MIAILSELRRVAEALPDGAITRTVMEMYGRVSMKKISQRFGSLAEALEAAGLSHRTTGRIKTRGGHAATGMSDATVLASLQSLATRLGRNELTGDDINECLPFSEGILRKRWGSLKAAFEAAGLKTTNAGRRYSDEECFDNLLAVWTHYGRPPMHKEMSRSPSFVGGKAYILRFGTWNKALAAFIERVKQDRDPGPDSWSAQEDVLEQTTLKNRVSSSEDRREIPLGLRFRILYRDRFKCVLCGDRPARNPECFLHVDHILPWSRGGKTREDNLRTLCEICNVGRGNRFLD